MFINKLSNKINELKSTHIIIYFLFKLVLIPLIFLLSGILIINYIPLISCLYTIVKTLLFLDDKENNNLEIINNWLSCCFIYMIISINNTCFKGILFYITNIISFIFCLDLLLLKSDNSQTTTFPIVICNIIKKIVKKYNNSDIIINFKKSISYFENTLYPSYRLCIYNKLLELPKFLFLMYNSKSNNEKNDEKSNKEKNEDNQNSEDNQNNDSSSDDILEYDMNNLENKSSNIKIKKK